MNINQKRISFNYSAFKSNTAKSYFKTFNIIDNVYYQKTLRTCLQELNEYRSVSTGVNHFEREIIYIDNDESFTDSQFLDLIKQNGLPEPNYLSTHLNNNHHQALYFLAEPVKYEKDNKIKFLELFHFFNSKIGDIKATGWRCDNIFYTGNEIKITALNKSDFSFNDLYRNYCNNNSLSVKKSKSKNSHIFHKNISNRKCDLVRVKTKLVDNGSRHNLEMKYTYSFLRMIYKNTGSLPTEDETVDYIKSKKYEIAENTGKDPHSDSEIDNQVRTFYKKGISEFNPKKVGSLFNDSDRVRAITVRKISKLNNIQMITALKSNGKKQKEVSEELHIGIRTVQKYWNYTETDFYELLNELFGNLNSYMKQDNSQDHSFFIYYRKLLQSVKRIEHSYSEKEIEKEPVLKNSGYISNYDISNRKCDLSDDYISDLADQALN